MMRLFILDVPEFRPVIAVARRCDGVSSRTVGDHVELSSDGEIVIDRRATGVRHAVWYSVVSAVAEGNIIQFDKDALRMRPSASDGAPE